MLLTSDENGKFMHEMDIANKMLGLLLGGYTASSACASIVKYRAELPEVYEGVYKLNSLFYPLKYIFFLFLLQVSMWI